MDSRRVCFPVRAEFESVPGARSPWWYRHALTQVEVVVLLAMALLLASIYVLIMVPYIGRPYIGSQRVLSRRTICASNLRGIGLGMMEYASENNGCWPVARHAPAVEEQRGRVTYAPGKIGTHRGDADDPTRGETTEDDAEMSTTRNLWLLIRVGMEAPNSLICPSSDDNPNLESNLELLSDFKSWNEVSYGYQVPYGKRGRPRSDCHPKMPLVADKGPYGAALEAGKLNPGVPTPGSLDKPEAWQPWNSPNHGGDGQNVLFADTHVEWHFKPTVGVENDNIYTRWSDATGGTESDETPRTHGTLPTGNETPWSDTDTLIYP